MTIVAQKKQPKRDITAAKDGFVSSTNGKLHLYKSAGGFEGAPNNGNPVRAQKRLELQDDGSGSRIKFAIRGKHYDFYEHGKKICTVSKITWDRLMGDGVLPSEIPAMMCRKVERGARSSFRSQEIIGYDDYEGHRMIRGDSGEIY